MSERKLKMVLAKNDFADVLEKHMRGAETDLDRLDIAASALFVAAGFLGGTYGMNEEDSKNLAASLLRESKLRTV